MDLLLTGLMIGGGFLVAAAVLRSWQAKSVMGFMPVIAGIAWIGYVLYETYYITDENIRVDLVLFWPLLAIFTLFGLGGLAAAADRYQP